MDLFSEPFDKPRKGIVQQVKSGAWMLSTDN